MQEQAEESSHTKAHMNMRCIISLVMYCSLSSTGEEKYQKMVKKHICARKYLRLTRPRMLVLSLFVMLLTSLWIKQLTYQD